MYNCLRRWSIWCGRFKVFSISLLLAFVVGLFAAFVFNYNHYSIKGVKTVCSVPPLPSAALSRQPRAAPVVLSDNVTIVLASNESIEPLLYFVELTLIPGIETFDGHVFIMMKLASASYKEIVLPCSHNLTVDKVKYFDGKNEMKIGEYKDARHSQQKDTLIVTMGDGRTFKRSEKFYLYVKFNGTISTGFVGIYFHMYQTKTGSSHIMGTNFKSPYAHHIFPCFDEPNIRTKIVTRVVIPDRYEVRAFAASRENSHEGMTTFVLENKGIKISPDMVAFMIINPLWQISSLHNKTRDNTFTIISNNNRMDTVLFTEAQKITMSLFRRFVQELRAFPLKELTIVSIPYFPIDIINFALIAMDEDVLIYNASLHSIDKKIEMYTRLSGVISHQWFGYIISMKSWQDFWFTEGCAIYMQYRLLGSAEERDWMNHFVIDVMHPALAEDSEYKFSLETDMNRPDDVTDHINQARYKKGAAFFRMFAYYLEQNHEGLFCQYMRTFFTTTIMTFEEIVEHPSIKYTDWIINNYTSAEKKGYPLVKVAIGSENIILTQEPFIDKSDGVIDDTTSKLRRWSIPIVYTPYDPQGEIVHDLYRANPPDTKLLNLDIDKARLYFKLNVGQVGYYRVNYEESHWRVLINQYLNMSVSDRMHMIEETFALAKTNHTSYDIPLSLTKQLIYEEDYYPLRVLQVVLEELQICMSNSKKEEAFQKYFRHIIHRRYSHFQSYTQDRMTRIVSTEIACMVGHSKCIEHALDGVKIFLKRKQMQLETILSGYDKVTFKYGMFTATKDQFEQMFDLYQKECDRKTSWMYLRGLASVGHPDLLIKLFSYAKNETLIPKQDFYKLLDYMSDLPHGASIVWSYVRENFQKLFVDETLAMNLEYEKIIGKIISRFSTKTKRLEVSAFEARCFNKYGIIFGNVVKHSIDKMDRNIRWTKNYMKQVENWIKLHGY